jgi:glycosyltransferase involved in cell wall biosynthesis
VKLDHPNKRILFIDHAPSQPLSYARLKTAEAAGATSAVFYHGGFERTDIRLLIETARHYPFGAVTLTRCPYHLLKLIDSTGDQLPLLKNVVDMVFFDPKAVDYGGFREKIGVKLSKSIVLVPALITFQKGSHDLIDALKLLPLEVLSQLIVVFAGQVKSHSYRRWLEKKIKSTQALSTLSYSFVGNLDQVVLRQAYRDCKLVVLPSYSEGAPRVFIEAQAMGVRCVATDVGGTQDTVVDKRFVRLVNVKDVKEMSLAIKNILLQDEISVEELGFIREVLEIRFGLIAGTQRHGRFYSKICSQY